MKIYCFPAIVTSLRANASPFFLYIYILYSLLSLSHARIAIERDEEEATIS